MPGRSLEISFDGFTDDGTETFTVFPWWMPTFARRLRISSRNPIPGLRAVVDSAASAERLRKRLWKIDWVYIHGRRERELAEIDVRLAAGAPNYPDTLPSAEKRVAILRREIIRAFERGGSFLNDVEVGYHAAVAQVAGLPLRCVTPEICSWAFPEIPYDWGWERRDWARDGRLPPPDDLIALDLCGIYTGDVPEAIEHLIQSYEAGDRDYWFGDYNIPYGSRPSTPAGRRAALREMSRGLQLDDDDDDFHDCTMGQYPDGHIHRPDD